MIDRELYLVRHEALCCIPGSREELEGRFLGLMADLDPKGEGDNSMPGNRRPCPGVGAARWGTRAIWRKLDCLNPSLQKMRSHTRRKDA